MFKAMQKRKGVITLPDIFKVLPSSPQFWWV